MKKTLFMLVLTIIVAVCYPYQASAAYEFKTIYPYKYISSLTLDFCGVLWLLGGSILTYDGTTMTTVYPIDSVSYVPNDTMAIAPDGDIWFGGPAGIMSYDGSNWRSVLPDSVGGVPVQQMGITSIAHAADGSVWAGTEIHGLLYYDGDEWSLLSEVDGFLSNNVKSIAAASDGRVWIGTNKGLTSCHRGVWTVYTTEDGLLVNFVSLVAVDKNNVLWCFSSGLQRYENGIWKSYKTPNFNMNCLTLSPDGSVWVGIANIGFTHGSDACFQVDKIRGKLGRLKDDTWTWYTVEDGLPNAAILTIAANDNSDVYIGTACGCYRFDPDQPLGVEESVAAVPEAEILGVYPNPFNAAVTVSFGLYISGAVTMTIYNAMGQIVKTLYHDMLHAGNHSIVWDGSNDSGEDVSSGLYFVLMKAGSASSAKRILLIR